MTETARYWARIVAINVAATALATVAFSGAGWHTPWPRLLEWIAVCLLFSTCCSTLCGLLVPRLVPFVSRRFRFPMNWIMIVAALVGSALAGSLLALLTTPSPLTRPRPVLHAESVTRSVCRSRPKTSETVRRPSPKGLRAPDPDPASGASAR